MGFCTPEQSERFLEQVPAVEKAMVDSGIILRQVLAGGQPGRADAPARGPHQRPAQGLEADRHGPQVVRPLGRLLAGPRRACSRRPTRRGRRGTSPHTDDKKRGRLNIISHLLSQVPYEPLEASRRQAAEAQGERRARRAGPAAEAHPDAVLTPDGAMVVALVSARAGSAWRPRRCGAASPRPARAVASGQPALVQGRAVAGDPGWTRNWYSSISSSRSSSVASLPLPRSTPAGVASFSFCTPSRRSPSRWWLLCPRRSPFASTTPRTSAWPPA